MVRWNVAQSKTALSAKGSNQIQLLNRQVQSRTNQVQRGWTKQDRADRLRNGRLRQAWFVKCLFRQFF